MPRDAEGYDGMLGADDEVPDARSEPAPVQATDAGEHKDFS